MVVGVWKSFATNQLHNGLTHQDPGCTSALVPGDLESGVTRKAHQGFQAEEVLSDVSTLDHAWPVHESRGPGAAYAAVCGEVAYFEEALLSFADQRMP